MSHAFSNNNNSFNTWNCTVSDDNSKILDWLSPLEPRVRHRDIAAQRVDSIADWLLETEEFRQWHRGGKDGESNHATLFCDGSPGVGKSHIVSLVIDRLCDEIAEEDTAVTCFYFDFASRNEQSPMNMLGSLLRQLVSGLDEIPEIVVQGFRAEKKAIGGRGLQVSGILKMFQSIAAKKWTFICVDALDECVPEHRVVVLESLREILQRSPNTRVFMTGRPHVRREVERKLDGEASCILIQPTEEGVGRYLREKLRGDTSPDIMSPALEADIIQSIPEISSETFLLASLHIEAILRETTIARRGKRLKSVKDGVGLGDAYGATLERIKAQDDEKARLAIATLTWICHSERPLEVDELCNALAVEIGSTDFDPDNVPSIGTLMGCCQGLISVDKEASTVRLIHFTVQEYLCAQPGLFRKPHATIAEACLTYLNSQRVKNLPPYPLPDHESLPFLKYSSRYWGTHANRELSDHARTLAWQLLGQCEYHVSAVSLLTQALDPNQAGNIDAPQFSGLHCASFFGIGELVTTLIDAKGCDINQRDCAGCTPLSWAAENGHEEVVNILLERKNVDPNSPNNRDRTPLACAATCGHEAVANLLIGREDVNSNQPDDQDITPLSWAASEGHVGIVKLLLGREDVDPDRPDDRDCTPLFWAANNGHEGIVKLLLDRKDVDPNRPGDRNNRTPLGCAALEGHQGVVKLLLGMENVDLNPTDVDGRTPLGCAAFKGDEGVVKLLLGMENVDLNPRDVNGRTPLASAAFLGHEGVVKLLLDREDVDPDRPDTNGATPLLFAAFSGHTRVAQLLLEREDVDPSRSDIFDKTPLRWATMNGHEGVVKLLQARGSLGIAWDQHPPHPEKT